MHGNKVTEKITIRDQYGQVIYQDKRSENEERNSDEVSALIASIARPNAARASDHDFVLSNQTTSDFEAIYITSAQDKDWNGNLLGNRIALEPGATVKVRFPGKENSAKWHLNIVDEAGTVREVFTM